MWGAQTRTSRQVIGKTAEDALRKTLEDYGFMIKPTGQENWLPPEVHIGVRFEFADVMVRSVRFTPDFLAYHPNFPLAYWDSKANVTPNTPNFAVEKASLEEQIARMKKGERVVVAFWEVDKTWHANWADKLVVARDMSAVRHLASGSHTPFVLVRKSSTLPLREFLNANYISGPIGTARMI